MSKFHKILEEVNLAIEFGNNICFYGFGNKEAIMEKIKKYYEGEKAIVEVKGYDRNMLPNNILLKIYLALSEALNTEGKKENVKYKLKPQETCEKIKNLIYES